MEEAVGSKWHHWITARARLDYPQCAVELDQHKNRLSIIHRALGGDPGKRISNSFTRKHKNPRNWVQRMAGTGDAWALACADKEFIRLPETLAVFDKLELNRRLYTWLTALAAFIPDSISDVMTDNQHATLRLLNAYPGIQPHYNELVNALIVLRPVQKDPGMIHFENQLVRALNDPGSVDSNELIGSAYPVWMWFYPSHDKSTRQSAAEQDGGQQQDQSKTIDHRKKSYQAEEVEDPDGRSGLMAFRMESLFSWTEYTPVDRTADEEGEIDFNVAEDLDKLSISANSTRAKRLRMELDIEPSDDLESPESAEVMLPEWDYRTSVLKENHCVLKNVDLSDAPPVSLPEHLKHSAHKLRRQFESLVPQKRWLRRQADGSELDLDAWIEHVSDPARPDQYGLFRQSRQSYRDISCLLLADLSLSTDCWVSDAGRVIDIVRDSLFLFAEALAKCNDRFALCGFSSRKRIAVNWHSLKSFEQTYDDSIRGRISAIEPGFYTRMGAAIRNACRLLCQEPNQHKVLFLLTDGKPNDLDRYEGRYGIEDTRHALLEARRQGIIPYCVTIDQYAREYLPYIFGKGAYTLVQNPAQLPLRLPGLYAQLTQS